MVARMLSVASVCLSVCTERIVAKWCVLEKNLLLTEPECNSSKNSWRYYVATIANYHMVCCEAVRSAILATA